MIVVQSERKNGPKTMLKLQVNSGVGKVCLVNPMR